MWFLGRKWKWFDERKLLLFLASFTLLKINNGFNDFSFNKNFLRKRKPKIIISFLLFLDFVTWRRLFKIRAEQNTVFFLSFKLDFAFLRVNNFKFRFFTIFSEIKNGILITRGSIRRRIILPIVFKKAWNVPWPNCFKNFYEHFPYVLYINLNAKHQNTHFH